VCCLRIEAVSASTEPHDGSKDLASDRLLLWQLDLRQPSGRVEALRGALDKHEAIRREGEREDVWRRRVVGRAALKIALGRYLDREPRSLRISAGPNGKPILEPTGGRPAPCFNLAHSGDLCLIAICDRGEVGVDVEEIRERPHRDRLVEARFAPSEADEILRRTGEERMRAFYRCWTRKEAYLKALGIGLSGDLGAFAVSVSDRPALISPLDGDAEEWSLFDVEVGRAHAAAIAVADRCRDMENPQVPLPLRI
jgi:4'-phosphopantetheinyl transferase